MKICAKCNLVKAEAEFWLQKAGSSKTRGVCKPCERQRQKKYYKDNQETLQAHSLQYYKQNTAERRLYSCEYRRLNGEKIREDYANWLLENPGYHSKWQTEAYNNDLDFRIRVTLRNQLYRVFQRAKVEKGDSSLELLGCSVEHFRAYFDSLFKPGMTWGNHGPVWHIDHIKPCARFDLTDPEQQKICFHWTNLQPLFALDNLSKGAKYNG